MANDYPPPPPSGGPYGHAAANDPYAADRALDAWATQRGYLLNRTPDVGWYRGWGPFVYLHLFTHLGRELRFTLGEANKGYLVETFDGDALKQLAGEDRTLVGFVMAPRLAYRVAVRSRLTTHFVDDLGSAFDDLVGTRRPPVGAVLGDPTFESRHEVAAPTREEGNTALPIALRHLLLQSGWNGVLEIRPGGLVVSFRNRPGFDPWALDATLGLLQRIVDAAAQYAHPVTAPP